MAAAAAGGKEPTAPAAAGGRGASTAAAGEGGGGAGGGALTAAAAGGGAGTDGGKVKPVAGVLEWLDLYAEWSTPIEGPHASELLTQLATATQLQHLGLDRVYIPTVSSEGFAHLGGLSHLTSLQLSSCALDDEVVLQLVELVPGLHRGLRSLSLMGNARVTGAHGAIGVIASKLPQLVTLELANTGAVGVAAEQLGDRVAEVHSGCFTLKPINP